MTIVEQLFDDYNGYRFKTHHYREGIKNKGRLSRSLKPSTIRLESLRRMSTWCQERGIDPRHWLYSLFSVNWLFAPRFNQLIRPNHLKKYSKTHVGLFDNKLRAEHHAVCVADGRTYDPNRDLSGTIESIKRRYLSESDADRCMSEMSTTLGFHPSSVVCSGCSLAKVCTARLDQVVSFDIQALRRGDITSDQARMTACMRSKW